MKKKQYYGIVINGKFLSQKVTGVQRYAREIISETDKICAGQDIVILTDKNAVDIPELKNIRVVRAGHLAGNLWEQITLPLYAKKHKALCVNLCNMAPILAPDVVVVHDISFKVNKSFFSKKFVLWYNFVFGHIMKKIRLIATVSEFSRGEISREYGIPPEKILVTYNGWQHFQRISGAENVSEKYNLTDGNYCFAMSSMAPNKNFRWIAQTAKLNPQMTFAVSGSVNKKVFGDIFDFEIPDNLKFLGYVEDEEAKTLTAHCRAFLFPSYYEGFGIPPLEALSIGAKVIVSDRSCMREIFGDCVNYISPDRPESELEKVIDKPCNEPSRLLEKYSWENSAKLLYSEIKAML